MMKKEMPKEPEFPPLLSSFGRVDEAITTGLDEGV